VVEADYYEDTADWSLERHLDSRDELQRFEVTAGLISPNAERLLDVGTGNGAFLSFLEMHSSPLDLWGLERSKAAIAASRCRAKIIEGSIDALPFQDRAFDTVTALEVIEHLPHAVYAKALAEMARVASMQVLISVPYRERRLMVACPECGCRFSPIFHLRTFDEDKLVNLVPGFQLTPCQYVSTLIRIRPFEISASSTTPRSDPRTLPSPPERLHPPITQAEITRSSAPSPAMGKAAPR
jgi:cyclopropane fatty-acyl-phospholipid synthase-like methyltransferase